MMPRDLRHKAAGYASQLIREFGVVAQEVTGGEFNRVSKQWLECFCSNVKRNTGKWVYHGFRWHAYSFGHEQALTGIPAFDAYSARGIEPFYAFFETDDLLFDCSASTWPDLRSLEQDIYIFPHRMTWSFVTTHEMSMGLGPYFCEAEL